MAGRITAAHEAAKLAYEAAPAHDKPSAYSLARLHDLAESNIHRAPWYKGAGNIIARMERKKREVAK